MTALDRTAPQTTPAAPLSTRTPPNFRRNLDQAIIDHDPPTYRGIYERFRLAERGVNFWAFYRYARNTRSQAEKLHFAELVLPDSSNLGDTLPKLIAQRLFQTLLYEEQPCPQEIHRLTIAYRAASAAALAREKFTAALAAAGKYVQETKNDEFLNTVHQFMAVAQEHNEAQEARLNMLKEQQAQAPSPDRPGR